MVAYGRCQSLRHNTFDEFSTEGPCVEAQMVQADRSTFGTHLGIA